MTLKAELDAFRAEFIGKVPPAIREAMTRGDTALAATDILQRAVKAGDFAPEFALTDQKGTVVPLADLLRDGPVVLSFYRGGWCPYCNLELRALQAHANDFARFGAKLIAISPQTPDVSLSTAEKNALAFPVLSDTGSNVAKSYGIAFDLAEELRPIYTQLGHALPDRNGDESWILPIPATYVIDRSGKITFAYVDTDYRRRLEPSEIIRALSALAPAKAA
jgi:peroxiredoxin